MARYNDAVCRLCRREGQKLFLKGDRCYTEKCALERRAYAPGMHGQGRSKTSEYGQQLREKQKAKRYYGLLESQFHKYYEMAVQSKGQTGENLLALCYLCHVFTHFVLPASERYGRIVKVIKDNFREVCLRANVLLEHVRALLGMEKVRYITGRPRRRRRRRTCCWRRRSA